MHRQSSQHPHEHHRAQPAPDPGDPVDPDLLPPRTGAPADHPASRLVAVLGWVAVGGILGSLARCQATLWWPPVSGAVDSTTAAINLLGCLTIGILATLISDVRDSHPLARPFWITGVLGGFTSFSAYAVGVQQLLGDHRILAGLSSAVLTAVAAPVCAWLGRAAVLRLHRRHRMAQQQ